MYCGNCYTCARVCPDGGENDGISIWVRGRCPQRPERAHDSPSCHPFLPNNPALAGDRGSGEEDRGDLRQNARKHERIGEWIERVGWESSSGRPGSSLPTSISMTSPWLRTTYSDHLAVQCEDDEAETKAKVLEWFRKVQSGKRRKNSTSRTSSRASREDRHACRMR